MIRYVLAIAGKDLSIELRTKTAMASAFVFGVLVLVIQYFARDVSSVSSQDAAPGALWVTFTFAAMVALNRAFLLERENRAMDGILLSPAPRSAIFLGKMLANLAFVFTLQVVTFPLFVLFFNPTVGRAIGPLLLVMLMASIGFVSVGTLLSAMVVRTKFAELMLPLLLLPFLVTPVVSASQMTVRLLEGRPFGELADWFRLLGAFDVGFLILSMLLFGAILEE